MLAVALFALGVLSVRVYHDVNVDRPNNFRFATGVAVMALMTLPLAIRRRYAVVTLVCVSTAVILYTPFNITEGAMAGSVAFVAIYSVGAYCRPAIANWARAICITAIFIDLLWLLFFRELDLGNSKASAVAAGILSVGSNLFFFAAAWAIGDVARKSAMQAAKLRTSNDELHAAQAQIAEQAVLDERVRIARELHDVVAHHVSMMGVQAGAARRVLQRQPEQAAEVLSGIETSSRQAVAELQRLLGFLRRESSDDGPAVGVNPAAPQPGLSNLDDLVDNLREAGLLVTVVVNGDERLRQQPLPASVDLSAYRLTQEALTNAFKHGGIGTIVTVTLNYRESVFEISVVDDGRGRSNNRQGVKGATLSTGHGLIGMRERVALHGGEFRAGPEPGSGFGVHATFPLSGIPQSTAVRPVA